ncbi:DUF2238 domain-containing protein, partial [Escherichia coli]|uniref:DUF2238 domain-containing protein n=1 Tax=Escherichia coli TaxID=562 RepID=UPI001CDAD5F9
MTRTLKPLILNTGALALTLILIYTGISAHDKLTWLMEVTPVIIVVPLLLATARRYPLTPLLYTLIFLHAIILMVGGQYTLNRPGFPGECFICELRLPDHRFRWK